MEFRARPERSYVRTRFGTLTYHTTFNTAVSITPLRRRGGILLPRFVRRRHVHRYPLHNPSRCNRNPTAHHSIPTNQHHITSFPTSNPISDLQLPLHTNPNINPSDGFPLNNLLPPRLPKRRSQLPFRIQRLQLGK